jgi:hypothetical protein
MHDNTNYVKNILKFARIKAESRLRRPTSAVFHEFCIYANISRFAAKTMLVSHSGYIDGAKL